MIEVDQREVERFRLLALPLLDQVVTLARYLSRDAAEAEDAAQETFLRAWRYFGSFSGNSIKPWLFSILRNVLRSRDPTRFEPLPQDGDIGAHPIEPLWGEVTPSPESEASRADEAAHLRCLIRRLPTVYREALLLKEFDNLSYREIAEVTGVPIGTVMSRLARARQQLRAAWIKSETSVVTQNEFGLGIGRPAMNEAPR